MAASFTETSKRTLYSRSIGPVGGRAQVGSINPGIYETGGVVLDFASAFVGNSFDGLVFYSFDPITRLVMARNATGSEIAHGTNLAGHPAPCVVFT
jgi:hypothetical protein